jgi:hypothetical protein
MKVITELFGCSNTRKYNCLVSVLCNRRSKSSTALGTEWETTFSRVQMMVLQEATARQQSLSEKNVDIK